MHSVQTSQILWPKIPMHCGSDIRNRWPKLKSTVVSKSTLDGQNTNAQWSNFPDFEAKNAEALWVGTTKLYGQKTNAQILWPKIPKHCGSGLRNRWTKSKSTVVCQSTLDGHNPMHSVVTCLGHVTVTCPGHDVALN